MQAFYIDRWPVNVANASRPEAEGHLGGAPWKGLKVLLVDDVLTTGASISTYAHYIRKNGGRVVAAAVIVRNGGFRRYELLNPDRY